MVFLKGKSFFFAITLSSFQKTHTESIFPKIDHAGCE